ncbi:MAG: calcium/sodium antiporter [Chromatiales bacterium]|nr:calcium/sodium antiporter [Chromatiales bacterium]
MLWSSIFAVIGGFALLVWGADRFVIGASATARNLGVSPLIIGLTIVGFGTSAPEMLVSAIAAGSGNPNMGIGNAVGSNITNIGLVLGITALVTPLAVRSETLKREFPILFLIMVVALLLLVDNHLGLWDGIILLIGMGIMVYWMISLGLRERKNGDPMESEFIDEIPAHMPMKMAIFWLVLGMAILLGSSRMLVWGAVNIAQWFEISDLVIGLTIVAIGTSLPELAASVMSAMKGEHDIAVGNVIGSNMFNLLAVLGLPGLIHPTATPAELLGRDFPAMIILTILLFAMSYGFRGEGRVTRGEGAVLLIGYVVYMGMLYHDSVA